MRAAPALLLVCSLLLAGCAATESEAYYRPLSMAVYPPKPDDAQIPILGAFPPGKYQILGAMDFGSTFSQSVINRCLVHNARRVGADAVVITGANTTATPYSYTVPGYTTQQPVTTYSQATANYFGTGGYGYGMANGSSTSYVPVYHEGYSGTGVQYRTDTHAVMIRFGEGGAGSGPRRSFVGVMFDLSVPPPHRLVKSFAPGSKAVAAGILPGDDVVSVNGLPARVPRTEVGLGVPPGTSVTVVYLRDGVSHRTTVRTIPLPGQ